MGKVGKPMRVTRRGRWIIAIGLFGAVGLFIAVPTIVIAQRVPRFKSELRVVRTDLRQKKFQQLDFALGQLHGTLATVQDAARLAVYMRLVPHYGALYANSMRILAGGVDVTEAASIALQGVPSDLTQHKIPALVTLLTAWRPKIAPAMPWIKKADVAWNAVQPRDLPGILQARWPMVSQIRQLMPSIMTYAPTLASAGPTVAQLMGEQQSQRYLVMFENSGELRATGGFMTAYGYLVMSHGKVASVSSQNIYTPIDGTIDSNPW